MKFRPLVLADDVADAFRLAAAAGVLIEAIDIEAVIKAEFLAGLDVADGIDVDSAADDAGFAVGRAGVVDPARGVFILALLVLATGGGLLLAMGSVALAQPADYPNKSVRIITDAAAGNANDVTIRLLGEQLQQVWKLRRVLSGLAQDGSAAAGLELLIDRLKTFRTNDEFLTEIAKQPGM